MYLLCTGEPPFKSDDKIENNLNLVTKLSAYSESKSFSDMIDFISKLLENQPDKRISASDALFHPWLR